MIDQYYKSPVFWDVSISLSLVGLVALLIYKDILHLPTEDHIYSTVSDMSTVALTMAGFILTLVTLLISFKSTSKINSNIAQEDNATFDLFFASNLYPQTVRILNNSIKEISVIALLGYFLKLTIDSSHYYVLFYDCVFGGCVILLTVWRCVAILTRIVKIQTHE